MEKKFGICLSNISLEQRKLILQNKINPFTLSGRDSLKNEKDKV